MDAVLCSYHRRGRANHSKTPAPRPNTPEEHICNCTYHGFVTPRAAEGSASQQHTGHARRVRRGKFQRGRVAGIEKSPRAERGKVAAEADERQKLGLGAVPEPVLFKETTWIN